MTVAEKKNRNTHEAFQPIGMGGTRALHTYIKANNHA